MSHLQSGVWFGSALMRDNTLMISILVDPRV